MEQALSRYLQNVWLHKTALAGICALTLVYAVAGGLDIRWGLVGLTVSVIAVAVSAPDRNGYRDSQSGQADARSASTRLATISTVPVAVLDGLHDAALIVDGNLTIRAANTSAAALSPVTNGRSLITWNRSPELQGTVAEAVRSGMQQRCNVRLTTPIERSLDVRATPSGTTADGNAAIVLITLRDLTDQEQLTRMRADFVANASHELRTPLASLRGFIETLQGAAKDDPNARSRFLGIMQAQAERMSRLIDDLLSLSRIEMREHVPPTGAVDIGALVADAARGLGSLAEESGMAIRMPTMRETLQAIGDRDELMQVFQNLIQNAVKYGRKGGFVDVSIRHDGGRIIASIADNGIGIAPEHLPRLTERFYRVSAKDSKDRGGTGLGLAIVKHIVNRHRGELRITSELGKGSIFSVVLPAAPPPS